MRIKCVTLSTQCTDYPIRFPAPTQPALRNASDIRLKTEDTEDDEIKHEPKILDAKKEINFGGRSLL